jgi:hypothetical protein
MITLGLLLLVAAAIRETRGSHPNILLPVAGFLCIRKGLGQRSQQ